MPARPHRLDDAREGRARIGRVVQHARAIDHVERARRAAAGGSGRSRRSVTPVDAEAPRRRGAELQRAARQVGADHHAVGAREVEAHLAGAAADLDDARVAGDRVVEQRAKALRLGAGAQPGQAVARRIAGERRRVVELRARPRSARRPARRKLRECRRARPSRRRSRRSARPASSAPPQAGQASSAQTAAIDIRRSSR